MFSGEKDAAQKNGGVKAVNPWVGSAKPVGADF